MNPLSIITQGFLCSGTGGGLPFPVPVTIVSVENISVSNAISAQVDNQVTSTGIDNQVASEQVDVTTGNNKL